MNRCSRWFLIFEDSSKKSVMNRSRPYASMRPLTVPTTTMLCQKRKKKKRNVNNMWLTHQMHLWSVTFLILAPKSLEMSAVTLSIYSSCVNTNMVGVKNYTHTQRWELIWYSRYPLYNALSWQTHIHSSHQSQLHTAAHRGVGATWVWQADCLR